ncbi:HNH endonuclease [Ralstonia wenshanensis]|uniref:HNH endonuclease n=1 Tax=Ralstonia wenshanensis TaxID=2842456 RepID=UPI0021B3323C|nr:HNH endonuclease signature motif containing protein [Ralstonia wenshanensis]MCT7308640.1 HNH endonuclease [Ralstonia wenshanensis]
MKITADQIRAAYEVASKVFDGELSATEGAQWLHEEQSLNLGSSRDFINNYRCLLAGRVFHRTLSLEAIDYFLRRIEADRGAEAIDMAIAAVYAHLDYYSKLKKGSRLPSMRRLIDEWATKRAAPTDLAAMRVRFDLAVKKAAADSSAARRARLKEAAKVPEKVKVVTEVYVRNPDVVAEVLDRAGGICERCRNSAPFIRRKGATPYLEVHHVRQLKDGGEDSVENAMALCPNCHREFHFGTVS